MAAPNAQIPIKGREWRFAYHLPNPNGTDVHMVKEYVHLENGEIRPNLRFVQNFERPVWVTKPLERTHQDKKEYEKLSKLDMHMSTQSGLQSTVARLLGKSWSNAQLGELCTSPYIYGGDIPSTTILHREMYQKNPQQVEATPYRNAAFDTETDVLYGTNQIIIGSMTMLPYVHLVIREDFLGPCYLNAADFVNRFTEVMQRMLGKEIEENQLQITFEVVKEEIQIVEKTFAWFHEKKPDWMSIWSMDFDVTKVMQACERANVDPKMILCDPAVPYDYRICKYKRAKTNHVSAAGKQKPKAAHDQWHYLFLTASFTVVDAMSTYRLLRLGDQEERSYSLDAILEKEINSRKLRHPPADKYVKVKWHQVMQRDHKMEYLAYAAYDTISMCLLDKKTRDLSHKLPAMADITHFSQCNSQPKRLRDAFYVFAREDHECIVGTVGFERDKPKIEDDMHEGDTSESDQQNQDFDEAEEEEEKLVSLSRVGWVLTLASHFSALGLAIIRECKKILTGIRAFCYDSDAVSSYPSCTQVGNVSKVTTRKELCKIDGVEEEVFRMQNLNLMFGETNAIEYATTMFRAPQLRELDGLFDQWLKERNAPAQPVQDVQAKPQRDVLPV